MQNAAEGHGAGFSKSYAFVVFLKVLLIVVLIAVSHGLVLLPVILYVASGSIYLNVADNEVEHGGGLWFRICFVWWHLWFLWRQSLLLGLGVDDAFVMVSELSGIRRLYFDETCRTPRAG